MNVSLADGRAYVSNVVAVTDFGIDTSLLILDVSDPTHPRVLGDYDTPVEDTVAAGDRLFVATGYNLNPNGSTGVLVLDVSNPAAPQRVAYGATTNSAEDLAIAGTRLFVADYYGCVQIFDVTDPSMPVLERTIVTPHAARSVTVSGQNLWVGGKVYDGEGTTGLWGIAPDSGAILAGVDTPGGIVDVAVDGHYAYVAAWLGGLQIVDYTNSPTIVGSISTGGDARGIALRPPFAYLASTNLEIIDVSDQSHPRLTGSIPIEEAAGDVVVEGNFAYVVNPHGLLETIDISVANAPVRVSSISVGSQTQRLAVVGPHVYVADIDWLVTVDVSQPAAPQVLHRERINGLLQDVFIDGNRAYLAAGFEGLVIFDVSQPAQPVRLSTLKTRDHAVGVFVRDGYAYVADRQSGLRVIDVSNPSAPSR
jgi:hypothetical protein